MKYISLIFLSFCFSFSSLFAQKEKWSKAKIFLDRSSRSLARLGNLGLEVDHGQFKPGHFFISAFSQTQLSRIRKEGYQYEVLINDVEEDFLKKQGKRGPVAAISQEEVAELCQGVKPYKIPENWSLGSMGGHLMYEEMLAHLDSMKAKFPNIITIRKPIDTLLTWEDRPIWFVKISDSPDLEEANEPKALYSAIHHAREPVSMHQLIFFMWYLLENYNSQPEIKSLVENSQLYFVPCLNPDGYIYNQSMSPSGGGMWRKNRRDNQDGSFGVDLNRNYGYNWGFDNFGSSPDPTSDIYRGPDAFSEPETRAMKAFCERHKFKVALNYHTYSNLVIHPWGYDNLQTPDHSTFKQLTREMTKENFYRTGTAFEVLNYNSNGSSDDFMYAPTAEKPKVLAMTPEVGDWFWPAESEILGLCLENVHQNLATARSLFPFCRFTDSTGLFLKASAGGDYRIRYKLARIGAQTDPATFTISFIPTGSNTAGLTTQSKTYSDLLPNQDLVDSVVISSGGTSLASAEFFKWKVVLDNGIFTSTDSIFHVGGSPSSPLALFDPCEQPSAWAGNWVFSADNSQQGLGHLKTSQGNYSPNSSLYMARVQPFDLRDPGIVGAELSLYTRYEIERNYDYASMQLSIDSGLTWTTLCTDKSTRSSPFSQQAGPGNIIPIWDGVQDRWQKEYANLSGYLGNKVWLRFYFHSDEFEELGGMEVDNIQITINQNVVALEKGLLENRKISLSPNPSAKGQILSVLGLNAQEEMGFQLTDMLGRKLESGKTSAGRIHFAHSWASGMYRIICKLGSGEVFHLPLIIKD